MIFRSPTARISLCLVCITVSVMLLAMALRLLPDPQAARVEGRRVFCEGLAVHCAVALQRDDPAALRELVLASVQREPEVESAAVRTSAGELVAAAGDHAGWDPSAAPQDHLQVPLNAGDRPWGRVELRFRPLQAGGLAGLLRHPLLPFVSFYGPVSFLAFFLFVRVMFRQLNLGGARVVPNRVRTTLNTLAEGVVILDKDGQIVLANDAFAATAGLTAQELQGCKVSELAWEGAARGDGDGRLPWERALDEHRPQTRAVVGLAGANRADVLSVNSIPIFADDGSLRGALASFDNLTEIEQKNAQLRRLLGRLQRSRAEIQRQNRDLRHLATRDPLTGCLNRRAFFVEFEARWEAGRRDGRPVSCVMVDVDHFKSVNDNHGHSTGDEVLKEVATTLREASRKGDLVCRYGGEEFCVLFSDLNLVDAAQAAERLRAAVAARNPSGLTVTASLGVSCGSLGAGSIQELLDQADKALYVAKRTGRNRVVRWDTVPAGQSFEKEDKKAAAGPDRSPIPFQAVNALLSPLTHRHPETAEHSRRVADLCVEMASGLLSQQDVYLLEVAATLHDIGKLGVPDAILLKPGPLTEDEWKVLRMHETIGVEMIATAFASPQLLDIVRYHHRRFGGPEPGPRGKELPLASRILAVADAYDSMVTDQVYRPGLLPDEAFAELRRCAGDQFDPDLVERLISTVQSRDASRAPADVAHPEQAALQFGLQMERIALAAGEQDRASLIQMVTRLQSMAAACEIMPIAEAAAQLVKLAESGMGMDSLTQLTLDLMEMCRSTYQVTTARTVVQDHVA